MIYIKHSSDDFSFNYALIDPGSEFYHLHYDLCEYHFVDGYEKGWLYEHYQNGKSFKIQGNDIIAMQPNVLHGGFNPSNSKPIMLGFVAGSSKSGPWRFDFNDRDSPAPKGIKKVKTIDSLTPLTPDLLEGVKVAEEENNNSKPEEEKVEGYKAVLKINKKAGDIINKEDLENPMYFDQLEDSLLIKLDNSILNVEDVIGEKLLKDTEALTPITKKMLEVL